MTDLGQVTFGGSDLDRAAHLRKDQSELRRLWSQHNTQVLLFWRGKPLLRNDDAGWLPATHPIIAPKQDQALFIGLCDDKAWFAVDISEWTPPEPAPDQEGFLDESVQTHPDLPDGYIFTELRAVMTRLSARDAEMTATAKGLFAWHANHRFCAKCGQPSAIAAAGWESRCASCGTPHFPRTDPVVIMLITHGNSVLLGRSPGWPDGMYSLLAGFIEPGETVEAAVRREVVEESGIIVGDVGFVASQPWPFPSSLMMGCKGQALTTEITIDPEEIEDAIWMTREELADVFAGTSTQITAARPGAIAHYLLTRWLADQID